MTALPTVDQLPWISDTHYGIRCAWLNEDGDLLALGHHEPMRVIAAMNRHARTTGRLRNLADEPAYTFHRAVRDLRATWAIVLGPCLQPSFPDADALEWHAAYCHRCDCAAKGANWIEVGHRETDRRAYPVTIWRA